MAAGMEFQMWAVFALIITGLVFYVTERVPMEVISIGIFCALLVFFHLFPVPDPDGNSLLTSKRILEGFANPALITVLALLVLGQGMIRTGILERGAGWFLQWSHGHVPGVVAVMATRKAT